MKLDVVVCDVGCVMKLGKGLDVHTNDLRGSKPCVRGVTRQKAIVVPQGSSN